MWQQYKAAFKAEFEALESLGNKEAKAFFCTPLHLRVKVPLEVKKYDCASIKVDTKKTSYLIVETRFVISMGGDEGCPVYSKSLNPALAYTSISTILLTISCTSLLIISVFKKINMIINLH